MDSGDTGNVRGRAIAGTLHPDVTARDAANNHKALMLFDTVRATLNFLFPVYQNDTQTCV